MNDLERNFHRLKEYFDKRDMELIKKKGISVFDTEYGLYGSSNLWDVFALFKRIGLEKRRKFIDLGSGDGRIALLASLFTDATGIEGDRELHELATKARKELGMQCALVCGDYTEHDLSRYDVLFIYADHTWPDVFQEKLMKECKGTLLSLHNIYRPDKMKKGKTYWIEQSPFVSYPLNTDDTLD